jgi:hypothetical protein
LLLGEVGDGNARASGKIQARMNHRYERLVVKEEFFESFPVQRAVDDSNVDQIFVEVSFDSRRNHLVQADVAEGRCRTRANEAGQYVRRRRRDVGQLEDSGMASGSGACNATRSFCPLQDSAGLGVEGASCGSEADVPLAPIEKFGSHLTFQPPDVLAQRRLGDVQALGGSAEVQLVGDAEEQLELTKFHVLPLLPVAGPSGRHAAARVAADSEVARSVTVRHGASRKLDTPVSASPAVSARAASEALRAKTRVASGANDRDSCRSAAIRTARAARWPAPVA